MNLRHRETEFTRPIAYDIHYPDDLSTAPITYKAENKKQYDIIQDLANLAGIDFYLTEGGLYCTKSGQNLREINGFKHVELFITPKKQSK